MSNNKFHTVFRSTSDVSPKSTTGKKHVVVLAGGMSAEREVSLSSAGVVTNALVSAGYRVTVVDMGADLSHCLHNLRPDVVFNCLHGTYGEDGCVPGLLNVMRIPYTHAGVLGSALAFNKAKAREVFISNNIKCAHGVLVHKNDQIKIDPIPRPYVIKPLTQGSSIGVELVFEGDDFDFASYQYEYGEQILVEQYIKAREMQVAVLNGKALDVILEIKLLKSRFLDYDAKYTEGFAEHILPANISKATHARIIEISQRACALLYASKGLARVEFLYNDEEDELYILEVNTHPGMTPTSFCPDIAVHSGMSVEELVEEILKGASYEE